jgi:hypothetical protein
MLYIQHLKQMSQKSRWQDEKRTGYGPQKILVHSWSKFKPNYQSVVSTFCKAASRLGSIRIRISGSIPVINGSGSGCGSGPCYFRLAIFKTYFFLLLFKGTFTFFKDKKSERSHKTVPLVINVFLTIFA